MTSTAGCHFCLRFSRPVGAQEKSFSKLIISYVARIYLNKGENIPVFLFDVTEYIKYADKRYMRD